MRAYPNELRESILKAVDAGMPKAAVARTFGISRSTEMRYLTQRLASGTVAPRPIPGRPPRLAPEDYAALVAQLAAAPDATLAEHCRTWERTHGIRLSLATMHRLMARLGWPRRRRHPASPGQTSSRRRTPMSPSSHPQ